MTPSEFDKRARQHMYRIAAIGALSGVLSLASICGVIYFAVWCLKHFGVVGQ